MFPASWSQSVTIYNIQYTIYMRTGARLQNIKNIAIYCYAEHLRFRFEEFFTDEALFKCPLMVSSVRCPS